tara:strand:+ start:1086 stop:1196 length:111 start_codon:yes stop_codon:yes gene_type:complete
MVWTRKPSFRTFKFTFFPKQEKKKKETGKTVESVEN